MRLELRMEMLQNANPTIFKPAAERQITADELNDDVRDEIDAREVFDHIRYIKDPEHPQTLEELKVVDEAHVEVNDSDCRVMVEFTPTIPHCSMATLIGLCLQVKLMWSLPSRFKVDVKITPGTHVSETAINKQLADKERVAAALENAALLDVLKQCLHYRLTDLS